MKSNNKVHYPYKTRYLFRRFTLCGKDVDVDFTSTDGRKVTCKRCKQILKLRRL